MDHIVHPLIMQRRSGRIMDPGGFLSDEEIILLLESARWAPSCSNNQPWNFIVSRQHSLEAVKTALSKGNAWAGNAAAIITVASKPDLDCLITDREYYTLDLGLAIENILLQGIYMNLVVHPIAGFNETKVKAILSLPVVFRVHVLIIIGRPTTSEDVDARTLERESKPRERRPMEAILHWETWQD